MSVIKDLNNYLRSRHLGCYLLNKKPLIITSYWHDYLKSSAALSNLLPQDEPVWLIFQIGYYKSEEAAQEVKEEIEKLKAINKNYHYWFLNNSKEEDERFQRYGLNSRFISQNAFLDENRYAVFPNKRDYDAIYLARFTPVKRHELAKDIKKLFLIGSYKPSEVSYYKKSLDILAHADYKEKVWGKQVSRYMNKACVGLCLSDLEGAMFVSTEYLLSGLPVVSTPSLGGRDIYYQDDYAKIVEPQSEAVADAVYKFIDYPPDSQYIRNETLRIMNRHREYFFDFINEIIEKSGHKDNFRDVWPSVFVHKLGLRTRVSYSRFRRRILRKGISLT